MRRGDGRIVEEVGNARGLIAIFCDEIEALEIADRYPFPDVFGQEVREAVERAYPKDDDNGG